MSNLEAKLNELLMRMGIPLRAVWCPDKNSREHARINLEEGLIIIFDNNESEALISLFHECLEYRLRNLISPYREVINKLIEVIEKITYKEKERVLDQIWNDFKVWSELEHASAPTNKKAEKHGRNGN